VHENALPNTAPLAYREPQTEQQLQQSSKQEGRVQQAKTGLSAIF
jgi:hypothetical protein